MGWASGSLLMGEVITALNKANVADDVRALIYKDLIPAFENEDWDTHDECEGGDPAFDAALYELHPEWCQEEEG